MGHGKRLGAAERDAGSYSQGDGAGGAGVSAVAGGVGKAVAAVEIGGGRVG